MTQNMYRVGDYVYFEQAANQPYQIRRIEELQKVRGDVEARVVCFYRRRDIPENLLKIADQADRAETKSKRNLLNIKKSDSNGDSKDDTKQNGMDNKDEAMEIDEKPIIKTEASTEKPDPKTETHFGGLPAGAENLSLDDVHLLRQRELFMSRQCETLSAINIRGKCSVVFLSSVETPDMYLNKEDTYFYSLVYDPTNETLIADKGSIEIGEKHQATLEEPTPIVLKKLAEERKRKGLASTGNEEDLQIADDDEEDEPDAKKAALTAPRSHGNVPILDNDRERLIFHPHHGLQDIEIDQYLILARAVGTFARALDGTCATKIPTLHIAAAAASRDITLFHALALLHHADYDVGQASKYLVPPVKQSQYPTDVDESSGYTTANVGGPLLCRDQLEEWSPAEAHIFAEALEKYNKDFHEIRKHCLAWKSHKDLVEYYYMFKTSGRYTEARNAKKQIINDGRLKQVYIPCYNKPSPSLISGLTSANGIEKVKSHIPCESCGEDESTHWYYWGPTAQAMRTCQDCWTHWKKRGGLKRPHESERFDVGESTAIPEALTLQKQMTLVNATGINRGTLQSTAALANQARINPATLLGKNGQMIIASLPPGIITPNQVAMNALAASSSKTTAAFFLHTTIIYKLARKVAPKELYNSRKLSRNPFKELNIKAIMDNLFNREATEIMRVARQLFGNSTRLPPSLLEVIATQAYRRSNGQTQRR
jgi:metastasis-associated protein MTA